MSNRSVNFTTYDLCEGDMDPALFQSEYENTLSDLQLTREGIDSLENRTIGQSGNEQWNIERKKRLTSSQFGRVFKMKDTTDRSTLVKELLSSTPISSPAIEYGQKNEGIAIEAYKDSIDSNVKSCGLFVHPDFGYLGASPDGLVGDDGLVEIKCPYSARDMTPRDAASLLLNFYCTLTEDGELKLKTNHNYFYQIQGQLEVTGREFCDFVVWTPLGMHVEKILRDQSVWKEMFPKLEAFYKLYLLPEIVDSRNKRGLPIRQLEFV